MDQDEIDIEGNTQPLVNIATANGGSVSNMKLSHSSSHAKLGPDRIYNKPVKIFKKEGNTIKREIHEKDAMNMFEMVERDNMKGNATRGSRGSS